MVDLQFGGVIQIFVEEDTRGESSESDMGGSQSVFDIFSINVHWTERRLNNIDITQLTLLLNGLSRRRDGCHYDEWDLL